MSEELILWIVLLVVMFAALAVDLFAHREPKPIPFASAWRWVGGYALLALAFGVFIWIVSGSVDGTDYFTGWVLEMSLSIDNVLVFALIFTALGIPNELQHRVLLIGVLAAIAMRFVFIVAGAELLEHFSATAYVFGGFLVVTGLRMGFGGEIGADPANSRMLRWFRKAVPTSEHYDGQRFFTLENGTKMATPLLVALVAVTFADIVFAVDSVPAILAITTDTYVVFAANAFAILGLRQLYFVIAELRDRFEYLHYGLALLLVWVGTKMILAQTSIGKIPALVSLGVILGVLVGTIALSWLKTRKEDAV